MQPAAAQQQTGHSSRKQRFKCCCLLRIVVVVAPPVDGAMKPGQDAIVDAQARRQIVAAQHRDSAMSGHK